MHDVRRHIASCLKFMALTACFHIAAPAVAQELNAKVTINRSQISNTTDAVFEALQNSELVVMFEMDRDDIRRRRTHQLYFQYHAENLQRNGQFIYWVDTGAEYTSGV